jgi:dTDP-4-dehydrorhamnose reductase
VGDLAAVMIRAAEQGRTVLYHFCGGEQISRYDFAVELANHFGLDMALIERITSDQPPQQASRPMKTTFVTKKAETELGLRPMNIAQGITALKQELQTSRSN